MSQPYVGEIRMFGGNFAPSGWAFCNGQLIAISQNDTLFNLIGTTYGGDGVNTFALPDLQGRIPIHQGSSGGNPAVIGQKAGVENVTLLTNQLAQHSHVVAVAGSGTTDALGNNFLASPPTGSELYASSAGGALTQAAAQTIPPSGGSGLPHNNLMPFLVVSFIISLFGTYPTQS